MQTADAIRAELDALGARRGFDAAAFEAGDDRLRRVHAIGELLLGQAGVRANWWTWRPITPMFGVHPT